MGLETGKQIDAPDFDHRDKSQNRKRVKKVGPADVQTQEFLKPEPTEQHVQEGEIKTGHRCNIPSSESDSKRNKDVSLIFVKDEFRSGNQTAVSTIPHHPSLHHSKEDFAKLTFSKYMWSEAISSFEPVQGSNFSEGEGGDARTLEPTPQFMMAPLKLECTLTVGMLVCADAFLSNFTLLPLRALSAIYAYVHRFHGSGPLRLPRSAPDDLCRAALMAVTLAALQCVDISFLYHYIRVQMSSYIKLYVIFNVLDVADRLCCSLGQDVFDTMAAFGADYPPAPSAPFSPLAPSTPNGRGGADAGGDGKKELGWWWAWYAVMTVLYAAVHSLVLLVQVVTLNVAINSQNNALITLLVATNFTEIKSCVFKRYDEASLLQVVCTDIVERFQLVVFLALVWVQNLPKDGWADTYAWLSDSGMMVILVLLSEVGVDWIKHAFVTKYNKFDPAAYDRFRDVLWGRMAQAWQSRQPHHRVARHVGFVSMPLSAVAAHVVLRALPWHLLQRTVTRWVILIPLALMSWLSLCLLKMLLYLLLLGHACRKCVSERKAGREWPPGLLRRRRNSVHQLIRGGG